MIARCPFDNGTARVIEVDPEMESQYGFKDHQVECRRCGARGPRSTKLLEEGRAEAIELWNKRI
jgi:hypothetical protein